MANSFNQIPRQCEMRCELEQEFVDKHGIVLSRNCSGPGSFTGEPDTRTLIVDGEIAGLDTETGDYRQSPTCRNGGFLLWYAQRESEYQQREADLPDLQ